MTLFLTVVRLYNFVSKTVKEEAISH